MFICRYITLVSIRQRCGLRLMSNISSPAIGKESSSPPGDSFRIKRLGTAAYACPPASNRKYSRFGD